MFNDILALIVSGFYAVGNWFTQLFSSVPGALTFVIAMFICFLSFRAILRPLIGSTPSAFHENRYPGSGPVDSSDNSPAQGSLEWYARTGGKR